MKTLERPVILKPKPLRLKKAQPKARLITNIDFVEFHGMSILCNAILLKEAVSVTGEAEGHGRIVGLIADENQELVRLDIACEHLDYEFVYTKPDVQWRRPTGGDTLRFSDGTELFLQLGQGDTFDIRDISDYSSMSFRGLLFSKIAQYCGGTHLPAIDHVSAGKVLKKFGRL